METDNLCKYLAEKYPQNFAVWLMGESQTPVTVLKTELSIEPIRADAVTFLQTQDRILHLEFQVEPITDPPLPLRMLDYWVRLHRQYRCPVTQVLILLKPTSVNVPAEFRLENTEHRYRVLRLWEQDPTPLLADPALLPLAALAQADSGAQILERVAAEVAKIEEASLRNEMSNCTQILAGLRYPKSLIQQLFREGIMRESVIYQEILQEGRQEGKQEGKQEGELTVIMRQLNRRLGKIAPEIEAELRGLSSPQLESLAEALLDFQQVADLQAWLRQGK
ncbi:MAG: Rpn family recombination-promoting nuclease/putative transposase [Aphanocapsa sp. GSE-SYN-MK-11-07L]|jgi:predicted transposase/invertase (TIGR01784 family)|nr:Rpn family recombination-promoting nuclease/putative transposase [Aphanocapsa sp. GSE-SYN-MK-11-07L]